MPQAPAKPRIGEPVSVDLLLPIGGEVSADDLLPPQTPPVKPPDDDDDELSPWGLTKVAVGRLFSNLAKMPVDIVTLLNDVANDPRVRTMGPNGYGAAFAERLVIDPAVRQARKAMDAAKEGRTSEAIGHGIAAAVPIVGPMSAEIGEQIGSGDPRQMAEATGDVLTFAAPAGIARAARVMPTRAVTPPPRVPMTRAERGGGGVAKFAESLTERTVPGSGVFERFRASQQQALQGVADDVVRSVSTKTGTAEEVGLATQRALETARTALQDQAGALYSEIDRLTRTTIRREPTISDVPSRIVGPRGEPLTVPIRRLSKVETGGVMVDTGSLKSAAIPMLRRIINESKVIPPSELKKVRGLLDQITKSPKSVSFRTMQDVRSDLIGIAEAYAKDPIPGKSAGVAKQLIQVTDDAMMQAAERSGIPGLASKVREANTLWRTTKETFNDTVIKKLVESAPEKVAGYVRSAELSDIRRLSATVSPQIMNNLRASLIRDMLNKATSGELGRPGGLMEQAGITTHGRAPVQPRVLSGQSLRKQMEGIGEAKLETLFGKQATTDLLRLADTAERVTPRASGMVPGLLAGGVNAAIFSPLIAPLGIKAASIGQSAVLATGFNVLARVLVRQPRSRSVYNQFLSAMSRGDTQQALTAGLVLSRMMESAGGEDE